MEIILKLVILRGTGCYISSVKNSEADVIISSDFKFSLSGKSLWLSSAILSDDPSEYTKWLKDLICFIGLMTLLTFYPYI